MSGGGAVAEVVIVSGLAGAGKTVALDALEDLGFYAVDNLPAVLLDAFVDHVADGRMAAGRIAVALDSRDPAVPVEFARVQARLGKVARLHLVFLEAQDEVLLSRFRETRRIHPLSLEERAQGAMVPLGEAIRLDREFLRSMRAQASRIIDTSEMSAHYLRHIIRDAFVDPKVTLDLQLNLVSFGFKHGVPRDLDTIFDVRCFANPHYVPHLRPLTGRNSEVHDFVFSDKNVEPFLERVSDFLRLMYPLYRAEGKSYLGVGIGCTGGKHRSVAIAESLSKRLVGAIPRISVEHRHLDRE